MINKMNNTETEMIGMKSSDAIKLDHVPLVKSERYDETKPDCDSEGNYRNLVKPKKEHGDGRKRETDNSWSKKRTKYLK